MDYDLHYIDTISDGFIISEEFKLERDKLLTTLIRLNKEFYVSFELWIDKHSNKNGHLNIIHLTTGLDASGYGSRIPGVWLHERKLNIISAVSHSKYIYTYKQALDIGRWYKIEIQQIIEQGIVWNESIRQKV